MWGPDFQARGMVASTTKMADTRNIAGARVGNMFVFFLIKKLFNYRIHYHCTNVNTKELKFLYPPPPQKKK